MIALCPSCWQVSARSTSALQRIASRKPGAPAGTSMNEQLQLGAVVDVFEFGCDVKNSRRNGHFLEQRDGEDLQAFVEAHVEQMRKMSSALGGGQDHLVIGDETGGERSR
jgi:hypothetical protein